MGNTASEKGGPQDVEGTEQKDSQSKMTEAERVALKKSLIDRRRHLSRDYEVKKKLGEGNFALVRLCTRKKDQKDFAVKIIHRKRMQKPKQQKALEREIEIMLKISHPNCVRLEDIRETQNHVYLVLELCQGGELFDMICKEGSFSEKRAVKVVQQITSALSYLHDAGVVHRDIKPENILLEQRNPDSTVKLTDFGLANRLDGANLEFWTSCGTLYYAAPEVLGPGPYGPRIDFWSLGIVLYVLLVGYLPFYHDSREITINLIKRAKVMFDMTDWADISPQARDLIRKLLTADADKRYNCEQIMNHEWMTQNLPEKELGTKQLQRYNKWKMGFRDMIDTVVAINRWKQMANVKTTTRLNIQGLSGGLGEDVAVFE